MSPSVIRPLLSASVIALALAGAPAAYAAPGDNGDVKVHDSHTGEFDQRNDPKVCRFYLDAFNFDAGQKVSWTIAPQPPKADLPSLQGALTTDANGHKRTANLSLPEGMYKLDWTFEGEQGSGKHKVFQVDCPGGGGTNGGGPGGGGHGHKPPHGPVGAGGGGVADTSAPAGDSGSGVAMGAAAAGLAGAAGLILVRRSRRRADGAA
ncbi:hypothetical protein [Streptomyces xanthii]|uniref:Gram-positive cocci surface proteins LPxTG domain-containing protein n=1 Tax=Streptomyces xanthii TaxID=2768069 RepID=A0A7H1BEH0_9ACTN|nr:hypothetical protein [Streptomyces xanthii]QNS07125.1 hypothetical protein IAG42_28390 [Streptomyces xanthii]